MTIIPTYDTDVLGYWVAENEDLLAELKIDLAPSASRCTINLQVSSTLYRFNVGSGGGGMRSWSFLRACQ